MNETINEQIESLQEQADGLQYRIDAELRKARRSQTSIDRLFHENRAQVIRKKRRAVVAKYIELEEANGERV